MGVGFLSLIVLLLLALVVVYILSEVRLRHRYAVPTDSITLPTDSISIAEGQRLARLRGCAGGCHGSNIEGGMFIDDALLARLPAPNLTAAVRDYTDAELVAMIRYGIRPDGRSVVGMPSEMFRPLNNLDLGKILAYLRSEPVVQGQERGIAVGPLGRVGLVLGKYLPAAALVETAEQLTSTFPTVDSLAAGVYLARTVCTECHGLDLSGDPGGTSPDLRIVAGYSPETFTQLMRTGKALGNRELKLMSQVARGRFVHFTAQEIGQLYAYLKARAAEPQTSPRQ
jgi:cytochrome c553